MSSTSSLAGRKLVLSTLLETDHYESLIKDLTCTKCNKYMKPPIHLCVDGHSLCGPCYEKSYQCHLCKKEFALVRPMVLESLANKVLFPCTNEGCPKHANLPLLEKHIPHCQFRIINCFMARVYGDCSWEGRAGEWMDHCFVAHKQKVTELPFITVKDKWDAKRTEPVLNYFLMKCYEKVFNVYQIYDKKGGRMMWTVLVNDDNADKFYFEVDLFLPNLPSKRIIYRRPCKCEKDADFLEHTQNVYIPVENVFSMLDESEAMNFTIRIAFMVTGRTEMFNVLPSASKINFGPIHAVTTNGVLRSCSFVLCLDPIINRIKARQRRCDIRTSNTLVLPVAMNAIKDSKRQVKLKICHCSRPLPRAKA